jgi:hypothetical protein
MKNIINIILLILLTVLITSGCIKNVETELKSWVGHPLDEMTASWGAPENVINREDGGKTYTWFTTISAEYGGGICKRSVTTNSKNLIVTWSYNNCPKWYF